MEYKEQLDPVDSVDSIDPEVQMIKVFKSKDSIHFDASTSFPLTSPSPSTHNLNLNFPPYDILCSVLSFPALPFPSLPFSVDSTERER